MTTVYCFPNGFQREATATYQWLRHYGLTPQWGDNSDGKHRISLQPSEIDCLILMAQHNPARFGNASTIKATSEAA